MVTVKSYQMENVNQYTESNFLATQFLVMENQIIRTTLIFFTVVNIFSSLTPIRKIILRNVSKFPIFLENLNNTMYLKNQNLTIFHKMLTNPFLNHLSRHLTHPLLNHLK